MLKELYTSGDYLTKNPTWHIEDSLWKAKQIFQIMIRNHITHKTICEVGCGAGEILRQLQTNMNDESIFSGYEISPQAFELATSRANERLHFKLADITQDNDAFFDLILVIDVIEHLENYFEFLRKIKTKSTFKIFHIPLDLTMNAILQGNLLKVRHSYGHIQYFTKDIALEALNDVGYEVLDYFYTPASIEIPSSVIQQEIKRKLLKLPRKLFFKVHQDLAVRILGGWSLLVLAK
jgi:hypothetical protein